MIEKLKLLLSIVKTAENPSCGVMARIWERNQEYLVKRIETAIVDYADSMDEARMVAGTRYQWTGRDCRSMERIWSMRYAELERAMYEDLCTPSSDAKLMACVG